MRHLAIINPGSRGGATGRRLPRILDALKGSVDDHAISTGPGACEAIARTSGEYGRLVAVGGDGTVCEVLRGMDRERQELGIVAAGTGNSFARDISIRTLAQAAAALIEGRTRPLDLLSVAVTSANGKTEERLCCGMVSIGYAARVTDFVNRRLKKLGRFSYPLAALIFAGRANTTELELQYDEGAVKSRQLTCVLIGNTRHVASFEAFPQALLDDGRIDVLELDTGFLGQNLYNFSVLTRGHFFEPAVSRSAEAVCISSRTPQLLMIDGEVLADVVSIRVRVIPGGVRCRMPV